MKLKIYIFILLLFNLITVKAQESNTLYFMHDIPQSNLLNPAVQHRCKYFIGIPALSSIYLDFSTGVTYNNIFTKNSATNKYDPDIDKLITKLHTTNYLSASVNVSLISLGYRYKDDYYFTFAISDKAFVRAGYPKDLLRVAWQGNTPFEGGRAGFDNLNVDFNYYREYALGVSQKINNLTIGVKGKLLFGKGNLTSKKTEIGLLSDASTFDITLNSNIQINSSLPIIVTQNADSIINTAEFNDDKSIMDIIFNRKNLGLAVDAGVIYDLNDYITLSASVIDLGFIRWKSDLNNISQDGTFTYTGPDKNDTDLDNYFSQLIDSIQDSFMPDPITHKSYLSSLSTKIYFGGIYKLTKKINFGALSRSEISHNRVTQAFTFSANANLLKFLSTSVSYTMNDKGFDNIGAGIGVKVGPSQFYLISDNLPIWLQNTNNINLRFGFNLLFGCKKKSISDRISCPWLWY